MLRGLELALAGVRPGLDQPPPGCGEGDRDSDMGERSDAAGVPGMAGSGARAKVPADRPDEVPSISRAGDDCCRRRIGRLTEERRRRCEPVEGSGADEESSVVVSERRRRIEGRRGHKSVRRVQGLGRDESQSGRMRRLHPLLRDKLPPPDRNSQSLCVGIE